MTMQHPEDGQLPQTWRELAVWLRHARPAVKIRAGVFLLAVAVMIATFVAVAVQVY